MSAASDALLGKTDAELLFFVQHPSLYQPALVAAAGRELQRRGASLATGPPAAPAPGPVAAAQLPPRAPDTTAPVFTAPRPPAAAPAPPAPEVMPLPAYFDNPFEEPTDPRRWLVGTLAALGVVAGGLLIYSWRTTSVAPLVPAARHSAPDSLKLTSVPTSAVPYFNLDQDIARQLKLVPAAEQRQASVQQFRQYRELSRRFWQAQHTTDWVLQNVRDPQFSHTFAANQLDQALSQWHELNRGLVYGFHFTPVMADQLLRFRVIARIEQNALRQLQESNRDQQSLQLPALQARALDSATYLLKGLRQRQRLSVHL